jgi:hypothetical protein
MIARRSAIALLLLAAACSKKEVIVIEAPAPDPAPAASPEAPLREQVKVEEAPAEKPPLWSTATTYEERVRNVESALASGVTPLRLDIHDLGGWEFDERKKDPFPAHIRKLDGKEVVLRGFMLPDLDFENIKKFHLVRSLWGCCFGAPPGPNEIVRITLQGKGVNYSYKTLEITGTFRLAFEMTDGLLDDIYRVDATDVKEHAFDDPLAPSSVSPEQQKKFNEFVPGGVEF